MIKIQIKRKNGQWMTVSSCSSEEGIVSSRLDTYEKMHNKVRAVDRDGKVIDYRY